MFLIEVSGKLSQTSDKTSISYLENHLENSNQCIQTFAWASTTWVPYTV